MHSVLLGIALSLVGVKTGWEPVDGGGLCYIVQLDSINLDVIQRQQQPIRSSLPPEVLQDLREIRIEMGTVDPPQRPPRSELLRKLDLARAEAKSASTNGTGSRDAPDDSRWGADTMKSLVEFPRGAADGKKKGASGMTSTAGEKPPRKSLRDKDADEENASPTSEKGTPATPPSPLRPSSMAKGLNSGDGKADSTKAGAKTSGDKKDEDNMTGEVKKPGPKKPASPAAWAWAFFISLGGNCCLGWFFWESRMRCRALLRSHHDVVPLDAAESDVAD